MSMGTPALTLFDGLVILCDAESQRKKGSKGYGGILSYLSGLIW